MQPIQKKKAKSRPWLRWALLAALVAALIAVIVCNRKANEPTKDTTPTAAPSYGELVTHTKDEVQRVQVTLRSGEGWVLVRGTDGAMEMENDPGFVLDDSMTEDVLAASCVVSYDRELTDDPADYIEHLEDFGLDQPRVTAVFSYTDGTTASIRVGNRSETEDNSFYYMLVDGSDSLYALDLTTAGSLCVEKALLHAVVQPVIHEARIDFFSATVNGVTAAWQLDGKITDADAEDRWMLVSPVTYPAEGSSVANLRANLANLRLGGYICDADEENLARYGFTEPRMVLTVHMSAGTIGVAGNAGVYNTQNFPESTFTITVGGEKSDMVDYVLVDGCIYTTSHFLLQAMMEVKPVSTLTRYPVRVTLSNLTGLTVEQNGETHVYTVERVEAVDAETNLPITNDDGTQAYESSVLLDGENMAWDSFEMLYNSLLATTVSGTLPDGWQPTGEIHTRLTFSTRTGTQHTIELTDFDAMHDAVICDGCAMFYLIKGGMKLVTKE